MVLKCFGKTFAASATRFSLFEMFLMGIMWLMCVGCCKNFVFLFNCLMIYVVNVLIFVE